MLPERLLHVRREVTSEGGWERWSVPPSNVCPLKLALALVLVFTACEADVVLLQSEQATGSDAITLEVQVQDTALAQSLGANQAAPSPMRH